jgi:3-methyladenine DNA glycosylase AlkD
MLPMPHSTADDVLNALHALAKPEKVKQLKTFFKTNPGDYADSDMFIGVYVPDARKVVKQYQDLPLEHIPLLLESPINEVRLTALMILVNQFKTQVDKRQAIYECYVANMAGVNNWNLVDASAHYIMGAYLEGKDKAILHRMAASHNLWERRIAMVACWHDIKRGDATTPLAIAETLLDDHHDLIHKAVGWMLRELGKRDVAAEKSFLEQHAASMPRTMLRYAIERFSPQERQYFMKKA